MSNTMENGSEYGTSTATSAKEATRQMVEEGHAYEVQEMWLIRLLCENF
ncbi:hypothetical protein CXB51_024865 [Gossypium anomalum]|uniref:Uncharacterized protein n=1 Tax=Gossypium anomalum TaxID=47600 RepID=A0A8J5YD82_9ROSI|nr:hypothetical protein CXB51_024865 [Gossypium anomalum]